MIFFESDRSAAHIQTNAVFILGHFANAGHLISEVSFAAHQMYTEITMNYGREQSCEVCQNVLLKEWRALELAETSISQARLATDDLKRGSALCNSGCGHGSREEGRTDSLLGSHGEHEGGDVAVEVAHAVGA